MSPKRKPDRHHQSKTKNYINKIFSGFTSYPPYREILHFLVAIPLVACQIQPDVMFGEHNDRFDLTQMFQDIVGYGEDADADLRRAPSRRFGRSRYRDDWEDDLGAPGVDDDDLYKRTRDERHSPERRHSLKEALRAANNPARAAPPPPAPAAEREVVVHYPLAVKLQVKDSEKGSDIVGIKLL